MIADQHVVIRFRIEFLVNVPLKVVDALRCVDTVVVRLSLLLHLRLRHTRFTLRYTALLAIVDMHVCLSVCHQNM